MPHNPQLIDCRTLALVSDIVVFDCRFNLSDPGWGERVYREGHLPGARFADLNRDLSSPIGPTSGRHPLPDAAGLARKLGLWGVDQSVPVAVYDDAGGAFAARLWWLLRWLGHPAVALLDGGLQAWSAIGGDLTAGLPQPQPRRFEAHANDAAWVTSAELVAGLDSCGSGVNACHNVLAMQIAGLSGSKLYAGSWSEWIRDPQRPVASGDQDAGLDRGSKAIPLMDAALPTETQ
jgi:3-mercaptopyruvate sulfurtransferase SseA